MLAKSTRRQPAKNTPRLTQLLPFQQDKHIHSKGAVPMFKTKRILSTALTLLLVAVFLVPTTLVQAASAAITVSGTPWGTSTCYIGATEGNVRFNIADLQDAGVNTY